MRESSPAITMLEAEFATILRAYGVHAALALLNARTRYRFTGLYRVEPPLLRNVYLYDRENPALNVSDGVKTLRETYCAIVVETERAFATSDSLKDGGLAAHAARAAVISYLGVPIRGANGALEGTLCHFDVRPRLPPHGEASALERVAASLADWLSPAGRPASPPPE